MRAEIHDLLIFRWNYPGGVGHQRSVGAEGLTQTFRLSLRVSPADITDCPCLVMILFLTRIDKNFPAGQRVRTGGSTPI